MALKAIDLRYTVKDANYFLQLGAFYATAEQYEKAEKLFLHAKILDPGAVSSTLILFYRITNKFSEAVKIGEEFWNYFPTSIEAIDDLAWAYFESKNLDKAEGLWSKYKDIEKTFEDTTNRVAFRHRLAMVKWTKGDRKKATELFHEQLKIDSDTQNKRRRFSAYARKNYLYDIVAVNSFLGNKEIALQNLDSLTGFSFFPYLLAQRDPLMDNIRKEKKNKDWADAKRKERKARSEAMLQALSEHEASDQIKDILER
jgi:tetratricopeptide (TPR) repeat protein